MPQVLKHIMFVWKKLQVNRTQTSVSISPNALSSIPFKPNKMAHKWKKKTFFANNHNVRFQSHKLRTSTHYKTFHSLEQFV